MFSNMYPYQKVITINRLKVSPKIGTFLNIYETSIISAMRELSHTAFKVYICLVSNKDGYKFALSPAAIRNQSGLCIDTVRKAIRELEERGYIRYIKGNEYEFYEQGKLK